MDSINSTQLDLQRTATRLLKENKSTGMKFFLMDEKTRDNLVKIFKHAGHPAVADELSNLSEVVDFLLKDE